MDWRPINELSNVIFDGAAFDGRLVVYNSCQGPYQIWPGHDEGFSDAEIVRSCGMWEKFLVLPEPDGY